MNRKELIAAKDSRRHHYVPRFLLQNFTNAAGRLFVYDKLKEGQPIYCANPRDVFLRRDLNAIRNRDGSRDSMLERHYADLEAKAAPILQRIVSETRKHQTPAVSSESREIVFKLLLEQARRPPDAYQSFRNLEDLNHLIEDKVSEYERTFGQISDDEKSDILHPRNLKRILSNAEVSARQVPNKRAINILQSKGLAIAFSTTSNSSFVIGDYPLVRCGPSSHLADSTTELWLPISNDVAISPFGLRGKISTIKIDQLKVRRMNLVVWRQSSKIAAPSDKLLKSLASPR